ncbi:ATP-binding protein [Streptomyces sp. NPDC047108]|uniref:AAA family ATPase n=1 Tax=Streptomyces sp. NPDC047108 TaxID=3155025 RepID=UPI0034100C7E
MLLRFAVANFASIRDEQELSAIAIDRHDDLAVAPIPRSKHAVLPAIGVFGPNASGKSNVIAALGFVKRAVCDSHQRWRPTDEIPRRPFLLDAQKSKLPSKFTVEFVNEGTRHEYGFHCDSEKFTREWLYSYPEGKPRRIFERNAGHDIDFGPTLHGQRKQIAKMVRPNSLYLSAAAANNHEQLEAIYDWFAFNLQIATEGNFDGRLRETRHFLEEHQSSALLHLLKYADLGVDGVKFADAQLAPEHAMKLADFISAVENTEVSPNQVSMAMEVEVSHAARGKKFTLPLEHESSGTKTWLGIAGPIIRALTSGSVLVIDELDAKLHHHVAGQFVRLFQDKRTNPHGAQLIFNTHDAALLGPDAVARLRRDQVWLTEKTDGATQLYPLSDFKVRSIENIEKRYLGGRYGALPFFDESLLSEIISEVRAKGGH